MKIFKILVILCAFPSLMNAASKNETWFSETVRGQLTNAANMAAEVRQVLVEDLRAGKTQENLYRALGTLMHAVDLSGKSLDLVSTGSDYVESSEEGEEVRLSYPIASSRRKGSVAHCDMREIADVFNVQARLVVMSASSVFQKSLRDRMVEKHYLKKSDEESALNLYKALSRSIDLKYIPEEERTPAMNLQVAQSRYLFRLAITQQPGHGLTKKEVQGFLSVGSFSDTGKDAAVTAQFKENAPYLLAKADRAFCDWVMEKFAGGIGTLHGGLMLLTRENS